MPPFNKCLVVFSGIDGGGKSTQIDACRAFVERKGWTGRIIWSRGGYTPGFNLIKRGLRKVLGKNTLPTGRTEQRTRALARPPIRRAWLVLALLDLLLLYGIAIRWHLLLGRVVICDRYWQDTLIDFRLNFPDDRVEGGWLWRCLRLAAPKPCAAFLLLIPVQEALRRSQHKNEPFPDSLDILAQRLAQYRALAADRHWRVLDGTRDVQDLTQEITKLLMCQRGPSFPYTVAAEPGNSGEMASDAT